MAKEIVKQLLKSKFGSTKHHFFLRLSTQIFKWKYSTIPCQSLKRLSQWIFPGMSIWISSRLDLDYKCENKISSSMLIFFLCYYYSWAIHFTFIVCSFSGSSWLSIQSRKYTLRLERILSTTADTLWSSCCIMYGWAFIPLKSIFLYLFWFKDGHVQLLCNPWFDYITGWPRGPISCFSICVSWPLFPISSLLLCVLMITNY